MCSNEVVLREKELDRHSIADVLKRTCLDISAERWLLLLDRGNGSDQKQLIINRNLNATLEDMKSTGKRKCEGFVLLRCMSLSQVALISLVSESNRAGRQSIRGLKPMPGGM